MPIKRARVGDPRIMNLPLWASRLIGDLHRDLENARTRERERVSEQKPSRVIVEPAFEDDVPDMFRAPSDMDRLRVRFALHEDINDRDGHIEAVVGRDGGGMLEIRSMWAGNIIVKPGCANTINVLTDP